MSHDYLNSLVDVARSAPVPEGEPQRVMARGRALRRRGRAVRAGSFGVLAIAAVVAVVAVGMGGMPPSNEVQTSNGVPTSTEMQTATEVQTGVAEGPAVVETVPTTGRGASTVQQEVVFPDGTTGLLVGPADMKAGPDAAMPRGTVVMTDGSFRGTSLYVRRQADAIPIEGLSEIARYPAADGSDAVRYSGSAETGGAELLVLGYAQWFVSLALPSGAEALTEQEVAAWAGALEFRSDDGYLVVEPHEPLAFSPVGDMGAPKLRVMGQGWDATVEPGGCVGRSDSSTGGYALHCDGDTRIDVNGDDAKDIAAMISLQVIG